MKRILLYICIALATIGCAKDETINTTPNNGEIILSAGVTTRVSDTDDCAWKIDDQVGIYTSEDGEDNLLFIISDTAIGELANQSEVPLCSLLSGARTYYAYHPYDDTLSETTTTINIDCTTDQSQPLLWATATSNNTSVPLQFAHQYTKVQFSLTAGGIDVTSLDDATATLTGAYSKGKFNVKTAEFSDLSISDITLTIDKTTNTITAYLPPADAVAGNVKLWITAQNNTYLKTFTDEEWQSSSSYAYDIAVGEVANIANEGDDYYIYTAAGLFEFANLVNSGSTSINGTLMKDIDLGGDEWTPIGTSDNTFCGTFDGAGYEISGLYVTDHEYAGLFSYISYGATIKNLGVSGSVTGTKSAGGIVGYSYSSTIINCYNKATVKGASYAGGIVGSELMESTTIINCYNMGDIISGDLAGGIIGCSYMPTILACYNVGKIIATEGYGIIGYTMGMYDTISDCYWASDLSGAEYGIGGNNKSNSGAMAKSSEYMQSADFLILLDNGAATYNAAYPNTTQAYAWAVESGGFPTFDFTNDKPIYTPIAAFSGGYGTEEEPYQISNADDLYTLTDDVNNVGVNYTGKYFEMTNSIYLGDESSEFTAIGNGTTSFKGIFDGCDYEILGLYINQSSSNYQGLFGYISGATIKNLGVSGSVTGCSYVGGVVGFASDSIVENCYNMATIEGLDNYIGGVVGCANSSITSCYNTGSVSVNSSSSEVYVGGITGLATTVSSVTSCYNTGDVSVTASSSVYIGGVVGSTSSGMTSSSSITSCYNTGAVSGTASSVYAGGVVGRATSYYYTSSYSSYSSVTSCYNTGKVSGKDYELANIGGVIGQNNGGIISYCYYDITEAGEIGAVQGNDDTTNYCGLLTDNMKGAAEMPGTLLYYLTNAYNGNSDAWVADTESYTNNGYPILTWQVAND